MAADPAAGSIDLDGAAAQFESLRPRLFGIAYRMLGSAAEAEDVVQDAWVRWQRSDRAAVQNAEAFLVTTTTRLAINAAQSARVRRETYSGPWLPEPIDTSGDPALGAERAEALDLGLLLVLEKLAPAERAAYVLREAFDYPYSRIASILETSEANARQLVSRAGKHLASQRRAQVDVDQRRRLLRAFVSAARDGAMDELEQLFADDVVTISDGGGFVRRAARVPVSGRERAARFIAAFPGTFWDGITTRSTTANGGPSLLLERDGRAVALLTIDASSEGIDRLLWMMNPHKLDSFAVSVGSAAAENPS